MKNLSRRNFIKITSLGGAAFALGIPKNTAAAHQIVNLNLLSEAEKFEISPFVIIEKTGKISVINIKPDMGQGTFQSIPALICEELEVPLSAVNIIQSGGEKKYGNDQGAGGSDSVRGSFQTMRNIGAAAREMLVKAAAQKWQVAENECFASEAKIFHRPTNRSFAYSELAELAATFAVPEKPVLKNPADFKIIGKSKTRPDVAWKTVGKPIFGIDQQVPGMVFASVVRCPVFGGKFVKFDDRETRKVAGVQQVVVGERRFGRQRFPAVAVVAENYWAALKGRKALQVDWDFQGNEKFNSKNYEQQLRDLSKNEGVLHHSAGDFEKSVGESKQVLEAFYETPFVSHSPLEPMNCLAQWTGDQLELWISHQAPGWIKYEISQQFGIPADNIKINIAFSGGGFGRRLFPDVACEAASIAKLVGKPVKVIWTREDDTQFGPFRPPTFSKLRAGLDSKNRVNFWHHRVVAPSIEYTMEEKYDATKPDGTMMEATHEQAYEFESLKTEFVLAKIDIPLGYWRAVTSTTTAFAHECFMDELAQAAGRDPLDFRLDHLTQASDSKRVLQKLREVSGWGSRKLAAGHALGVAQWQFFAGLAGSVVEVKKQSDGSVKIEKIWTVIDLGTVVNPDVVRQQCEGAAVMALTAATQNGITFEAGRVAQSNFHDNPILRFSEMPPVEVHILAEGGEKIKGVGEPGLPPVAPALANAIFAATGRRIRRMPFEL